MQGVYAQYGPYTARAIQGIYPPYRGYTARTGGIRRVRTQERPYRGYTDGRGDIPSARGIYSPCGTGHILPRPYGGYTPPTGDILPIQGVYRGYVHKSAHTRGIRTVGGIYRPYRGYTGGRGDRRDTRGPDFNKARAPR